MKYKVGQLLHKDTVLGSKIMLVRRGLFNHCHSMSGNLSWILYVCLTVLVLFQHAVFFKSDKDHCTFLDHKNIVLLCQDSNLIREPKNKKLVKEMGEFDKW